jgi:hypothetical protein
MRIPYVFIFCLTISLQLSAQSYLPMPFGDARWVYEKIQGTFSIKKNYCYFSVDTAGYYFNGHKYWHIQRVDAPVYGPSVESWFVCDDTVNRKVWRIDTLTQVERLLYDFSLQPGDSIDYHLPNQRLYIDSVVFHMINGISRKHIYFHSNLLLYPTVGLWIEGIGSDFDFFSPGVHPLTHEWYDLRCTEADGQQIFGDSSACATFLTSYPLIRDNDQLIPYPNPVSSTLYIDVEDDGEALLEIIGTDGAVCLSKVMRNKGKHTLNVQYLKQGIYLLRIKQKHKMRQLHKLHKI